LRAVAVRHDRREPGQIGSSHVDLDPLAHDPAGPAPADLLEAKQIEPEGLLRQAGLSRRRVPATLAVA
jgi:hypothetical protein